MKSDEGNFEKLKLSQIIKGMPDPVVEGDLSIEVQDISFDSRKCGSGSLFVAVQGLQYDGHSYIGDAIRSGALSVLCERKFERPCNVAAVRVQNSRRALSTAAKNFYGDPSGRLSLIGITGTNGKTTISYLVESILNKAGYKAGVIGTINSRLGNETFVTSHTTPEAPDLHKIFKEMEKRGARHVIMEVSSHAIDLNRIDDCKFSFGVFTNLSPEHLDYHVSMEQYFNVKKRFFTEILAGKNMIINSDNPWGIRLLEEFKGSAVSFGIDSHSDIRVKKYSVSIEGIEATIETPEGSLDISSTLTGKFNLSNITAAVAVSIALGIDKDFIEKGIADAGFVPGRLQKMSGPHEPAVFIDYAHTEDALRNVLETLRRFTRSRLITVFGCGGRRDRSKRPKMGMAAAELSDITVVTSDNPRTEDPGAIIREIEEGIGLTGISKIDYFDNALAEIKKGYAIIPDRREAIKRAILSACSSDIVLIAGKGHEDYQIIGGSRFSFDDRIVAKEMLEYWRSGKKC
ncbi:MAG: UDP-N-acetylmuramoyl-L-alanyl-D-glutamate--2,6-diaminopimelate ligase [Syntrophales bacterium]|jgi:UDP-N-acetylmuramyl-tripeptide synthetase|nr:UDP-N-acetylmuramoyl-L-alanyl-D-glutamate--2,6-diaminopimelate ligase [Syntrophales bacterium]MDY0043060.1 UDP-N-acetylmuramoyl-L-alanyl-D-glutamate--2,6-diaminopimelate ligase [Syntrophales bacterium]